MTYNLTSTISKVCNSSGLNPKRPIKGTANFNFGLSNKKSIELKSSSGFNRILGLTDSVLLPNKSVRLSPFNGFHVGSAPHFSNAKSKYLATSNKYLFLLYRLQ